MGELIQAVTISLEADDDPQIIFETLNARGTPLLAMDLVKNALFHSLSLTSGDAQRFTTRFGSPNLASRIGRRRWAADARAAQERRCSFSTS